jgi:hypothetical protein
MSKPSSCTAEDHEEGSKGSYVVSVTVWRRKSKNNGPEEPMHRICREEAVTKPDSIATAPARGWSLSRLNRKQQRRYNQEMVQQRFSSRKGLRAVLESVQDGCELEFAMEWRCCI